MLMRAPLLDKASHYQRLAHEAWLIHGDSQLASYLYGIARKNLFAALELPA